MKLNKKTIAISTAALTIAGAGSAFAYFSSTGSGTGTATVAGSGGSLTSVSASAAITDLDTDAPITVTLVNGPKAVHLTKVTVEANTGSGSWPAGCDGSKFTKVTDLAISEDIAASGTVTLTSTNYAGLKMQLQNDPANSQDACKASIPLTVSVG